MSEINERLKRLAEYKERSKHLRGRHDQRDHTRHDYLANGLIGDTGGSARINARDSGLQNGLLGDTIVMTGRGGGSMARDIAESTRNLFNKNQSLTPAGAPTPAGSSGRYIGARPKRQASIGLTQAAISRAAALRKQAQAMAVEYWRRHRMTKPTVTNQGTIAPQAMQTKPYGSFFEIGNPSVSLFENPEAIEGNDPTNPTRKTNMLAYMQQGFDRLLDEHYRKMVAGGMPESEAQSYTDQIADIYNNQYEMHMRKAAASFAMDLQGFVGGVIYGNDSPDYVASRTMSIGANGQMQLNAYELMGILSDIGDKYPKALSKLGNGVPILKLERVVSAMGADMMKDMNGVIDAWAKHNPAPNMKRTIPSRDDLVNPQDINFRIEETPADTRKLSRVNPALVADIADRTILDTMDDESLSMPLSTIWSTLHPKIQAQLARMMASSVVYPQMDDASRVFEENQTTSLDAGNQSALDAFKSILQTLHTDGAIADVIVDQAPINRKIGGGKVGAEFSTAEMGRRNGVFAGKPTIRLSPIDPNNDTYDQDDPERAEKMLADRVMLIAHEFGHLIDQSALTFGETTGVLNHGLASLIGQHGGLPADTWQSKSPMVAPILRIIDRYMKGPHQRTMDALDNDPRSGTDGLYRRIRAADYNEYLRQPHEIIARLYEQFVSNEIMRKIDQGQVIPGVGNPAAFRKAIRQNIDSGINYGLGQRFFAEDEYNASISDLMEIFNIMGWKMK